jgi:hypothetical protein
VGFFIFGAIFSMVDRLLAFLFLALVASSAHAARLTAPICDAGARYAFEVVKCTIELHNETENPVHVSSIKPVISGDAVTPGSITVPAHGVAYVEATVHLGEAKGVVGHPFELHADKKARVQRSVTVVAYVESVLDHPRPKIDFGVVKMPSVTWPLVKSVTFTSREAPGLRITRIDSAPDWLEASIDADGRTLHASLKKDAPWGRIYDGAAYIKVSLDTPQQKVEWVEVTADIQGEVVPDSNPLEFGVLKATGDHEFVLRFSSPSGKDFNLGKMSLNGIKGKASSAPCTPVATGCRLARITISKKQPLGGLRGTLEVDLPDYHRNVSVQLRGYLLSKDTVVHSMDEIASGSSSAAPAASASPDLQSALKEAVKEEPAPPPGNGPLLRWGATHQSRIYGYVIYRSDSEDGAMARVNKDVILAVKEGTDMSGNYQWRDTSAESGKTYWYQIGVLNRDGSKEDLTGRQKVTAK